MKRFLFITILAGFSLGAQAQNLRFSLQAGAAVPLGAFAQDDVHPENGGFAQTGFDMRFVGERIFSNNFVAGMNLGFSMFGIDQEALKEFINPDNPELVRAETQAFQNINLQFRGGYNWKVANDNIQIVPFMDAGFGVFNSAYYAIQDDGGDTFLRSGNTGFAFLLSPGLDVAFMVNDFVAIKMYGTYQFANYRVDEEYTVLGNITYPIYNHTQEYKYSSICFGVGANVTL